MNYSGDAWTIVWKTDQHSPDIPIDVIRGVVCLVGIVGNALVVFVNLVLKEYEKTIIHWYVLQLAIADILFLMTIPFTITEDIMDAWIFPTWTCKAKETIFFINYYASILFLMVMSIDRYLAVCFGLSTRIHRFRKKRNSYIIAAMIWLLAGGLSSPMAFFSIKSGVAPNCRCKQDLTMFSKTRVCDQEGLSDEDCESLNEKETCMDFVMVIDADTFADNGNLSLESEYYDQFAEIEGNYSLGDGSAVVYQQGCSFTSDEREWIIYMISQFVIMFVLPFAVMTICYSCIVAQLRKSSFRRRSIVRQNPHDENSNGNRKSTSTTSSRAAGHNDRVTTVCFLLVAIFLICWFPFHAVNMAKIRGIRGETDFCKKLARIAVVFVYINSAVNPYVYNFIGTSFGQRLKRASLSVKSSLKTNSTLSSEIAIGMRNNAAKKSTSNQATDAIVTTKLRAGRQEGIHSEAVVGDGDHPNIKAVYTES